MLFFFCPCGFGSSSATSSRGSGSSSCCVPGTSNGLRKELEWRGGPRNVRESSDERGFGSGMMTGERAEISKDRLYESNDSREMLNGSFSSNRLRLLLLVVLRDEDVVQKFGRSGGDGSTKTPLSLISADMLSVAVVATYRVECSENQLTA